MVYIVVQLVHNVATIPIVAYSPLSTIGTANVAHVCITLLQYNITLQLTRTSHNV